MTVGSLMVVMRGVGHRWIGTDELLGHVGLPATRANRGRLGSDLARARYMGLAESKRIPTSAGIRVFYRYIRRPNRRKVEFGHIVARRTYTSGESARLRQRIRQLEVELEEQKRISTALRRRLFGLSAAS